MRFFIFLLLFSFFLKAQIFTETFSNFSPDTSLFDACYNFDVTLKDSIAEDLKAASSDFTGYGFGSDGYVAESVAGSKIISGGKFIAFSGSGQYFKLANGSNSAFKPGAADNWTLAVGLDIADANGYGFTLLAMGNQTHSKASNSTINGAGYYSQTYDGTDYHREWTNSQIFDQGFNTLVYSWTSGDTVRIYINGTLLTGNSQENNTFADVGAPHPADATYIGRLANGTQEYDERLHYLGFANSVAFTAQQAAEFCNLAKDWKSGAGGVARASWGFAQGISGSGLTVGTLDGGISKAIPNTLTATSTRYLMNFPRANTFSTDSIMFKTDTDSIWHSIPDTVLAGGLGIQIEVDVSETGGVVYIDNITVRGYATISQFKGYDVSSLNKFKGF